MSYYLDSSQSSASLDVILPLDFDFELLREFEPEIPLFLELLAEANVPVLDIRIKTIQTKNQFPDLMESRDRILTMLFIRFFQF